MVLETGNSTNEWPSF